MELARQSPATLGCGGGVSSPGWKLEPAGVEGGTHRNTASWVVPESCHEILGAATFAEASGIGPRVATAATVADAPGGHTAGSVSPREEDKVGCRGGVSPAQGTAFSSAPMNMAGLEKIEILSFCVGLAVFTSHKFLVCCCKWRSFLPLVCGRLFSYPMFTYPEESDGVP